MKTEEKNYSTQLTATSQHGPNGLDAVTKREEGGELRYSVSQNSNDNEK